ncbi:MAG: hypothetical protein ACI4MN_00840 [Candidatus Coproplasma sp.]
MKKLLKTGIVSALLAVVASVCAILGGCASPKTFSKVGMNITLTSEFSEQTIVTQTAYYVSRDSVVTGLKEEFSLMAGFENYTIEQYTALVINNNALNSTVNTREGEDYCWFTYTREVNGKDFFYLATTHKASDAFWLIQFGCDVADESEYTEIFLGWADSVTFTTTENGANV